MKLLIIGSDRNVFEPESAVRDRLIEQGALVDELHVIVFSLRRLGHESEQIAEHVYVHPTASRWKWLYLLDAWILGRRILREDKRSWLISAQDPFECGLASYMLSLSAHVPLHLQLHTDPFSKEWRELSLLNTLRFIIAETLLKVADGIRVVSRRVQKKVLHLGIPSERITVIPIYVPQVETGKIFVDLHQEYPGYRHIILSVGRLEKEKDFPTLLRAFREVRKTNDGALLIIVGSGREHARLVSLAEWLSVDGHVHFLPWSHDIRGYYCSVDCYVQPSLYEGWGLAVVEAMMSGAPVVMTDVGCAGEVVVNETSGLVVPVANPDKLAQAIAHVLGDHGLRERLTIGAKGALANLPSKEETYRLYQESWGKAYESYWKSRK